jgi:hypothetical protein
MTLHKEDVWFLLEIVDNPRFLNPTDGIKILHKPVKTHTHHLFLRGMVLDLLVQAGLDALIPWELLQQVLLSM